MSELPIADLQGKDNELGERVKLYINEKTTSKGVLCSMFLVQGVQIDKKILEANQQIYVRARQAKMAIEEQEAEHRKTLLMLAQRAEKEKAERAIEQENALHRHQLAEGAARAQAENERIKYQVLTSLGLSVENIIELEQIRAMQAIASSNNKGNWILVSFVLLFIFVFAHLFFCTQQSCICSAPILCRGNTHRQDFPNRLERHGTREQERGN